MQALGSYRGGRMLFLGLGTGLGSALVWQRNVLPLELGDLPYVMTGSLKTVGQTTAWRCWAKNLATRSVCCVDRLQAALSSPITSCSAGGNAKVHRANPPEGVELGHNRNAYLGGSRLWETNPESKRPRWRIV